MDDAIMEGSFKIVVLMKPVPDMEKVKFNVEKGTIERESSELVINPFDLHALEVAAQIKEKVNGTVTTISMAPPHAADALKESIARGSDRAILLSDRKFGGADTLATAYALASAIRKLGIPDLIVAGEKSVDGDTAQVPPLVAEMLGIPHASYVSKVIDIKEKAIEVITEQEAPYRVELRLPALIQVTKEVAKPRVPTLKDKLKAKKYEIEVWSADKLSDVANPDFFGLKGSPTWVSKIIVPKPKPRSKQVFNAEEGIKKIIEILSKEGVI
ncbi:electron transfer flavoprotein beta-subunit [Fervidicoccus fontis Kam940]|uniref:Electron transfer flavoprotein beta-subunit n=1 Tax=Fervidicoccus fontis (strain DSM 19380 / JCM 18336 / VKM B-2539 / Kam940) TaxID=1163730 RepID=I0A2V3_FERFK|nr:electron transfer flavoprotein beta-subunit [Fervidicoccus fontis Kam940]